MLEHLQLAFWKQTSGVKNFHDRLAQLCGRRRPDPVDKWEWKELIWSKSFDSFCNICRDLAWKLFLYWGFSHSFSQIQSIFARFVFLFSRDFSWGLTRMDAFRGRNWRWIGKRIHLIMHLLTNSTFLTQTVSIREKGTNRPTKLLLNFETGWK